MPCHTPGRSGLVLCLLAAILAGCDSAPPPAGRVPQSSPATEPGRPAVPEKPAASVPVTTPPAASVPATTQPPASVPAATQPAAPEPELPDYVEILERFDPQRPASVTVHAEASNRLVVLTRNVRRMRIDRERVPLDRRRSISLQLDGQGMEWLARSPVDEFIRSVNGPWDVAKPDKR